MISHGDRSNQLAYFPATTPESTNLSEGDHTWEAKLAAEEATTGLSPVISRSHFGPIPQGSSSSVLGASPSLPPENGSDSTEPDPPRSAYALLKCVDAVIAEIEFPLTVGLAKEPDPDISGNHELFRPASSLGPYTLQVQLVGDNFKLRIGESWRNELQVTVENPYPYFTVHLTAEIRPKQKIWSRPLQAIYSVDGHAIGVAITSLRQLPGRRFSIG